MSDISKIQQSFCLCSVCETQGDLIQCKGHCRRFFHMECAFENEQPPHDNICSNCRQALIWCSICHTLTTTAKDNLLSCAHAICCHSYHAECFQKRMRISHWNGQAIECPVHYSSPLLIHCSSCGIDLLPSSSRLCRISCFRCLRCFCAECCEKPLARSTSAAQFYMWLNSNTILCDQHFNNSLSKDSYSLLDPSLFITEKAGLRRVVSFLESFSSSSGSSSSSSSSEEDTDEWIVDLEHIQPEISPQGKESSTALTLENHQNKSALKSPLIHQQIQKRTDLDPRLYLHSPKQFRQWIRKQTYFHKRTYRDILHRLVLRLNAKQNTTTLAGVSTSNSNKNLMIESKTNKQLDIQSQVQVIKPAGSTTTFEVEDKNPPLLETRKRPLEDGPSTTRTAVEDPRTRRFKSSSVVVISSDNDTSSAATVAIKPRQRKGYPVRPELQNAYIDETYAQRFRIPLNLIRIAWKKSPE